MKTAAILIPVLTLLLAHRTELQPAGGLVAAAIVTANKEAVPQWWPSPRNSLQF